MCSTLKERNTGYASSIPFMLWQQVTSGQERGGPRSAVPEIMKKAVLDSWLRAMIMTVIMENWRAVIW